MISSAAHLVGAGMKAMGVGIPVDETSAKLIDGMRNVGIPVPPNTWFKRKGSRDDREIVGSSHKSPSTPKKDIYDKLEGHVQGVIKVVRPVIELKQMIREGCCNSADRVRRARSPSPTSKQKLKFYTPQNTCSHCEIHRKSTSPKKKYSFEKSSCSRRRLHSSDDDDDDNEAATSSGVSCIYCSRSKSLLELPCGRQICSKCDEIEDHELELKMPRRTRNPLTSKNEREPEVIPVPVAIIDLTQDSPMNNNFRISRVRAGHNVQEAAERSDSVSVILADELEDVPSTKKPRLGKPTIINLDETVNTDDSPKKETNQKSVSHRNPTLSCPICFECLADENIKAMTTPCGHMYCCDCLKQVTTQKKKCSICQRAISFSKCIRVHI